MKLTGGSSSPKSPHGIGRRLRGMSLIEVLVASFILALLMLGVLQMFSMSLLTDYGSAARTDLTYKCQEVVENLRYVQYLTNGNVAGVAAPLSSATGIPLPAPSTTTKYTLPYQSSDPYWAYWGPSGANVMEVTNGPYQIFYTFTDGGTFWTVTVTAQPTKRVAPSASTASGRAYMGSGTATKSVEYVAQLLKS